MNRKEQIEREARRATCLLMPAHDPSTAKYMFEQGAQWADTHPQWHNADDFPPRDEREDGEFIDFSVDVLAIDTMKNIMVAYYDFISCNWTNLYSEDIVEITHWMPMPELPNVEPKK